MKIVKIQNCSQCPFHGIRGEEEHDPGYFVCLNADTPNNGRRIGKYWAVVDGEIPIPEWCPLEEAK